MSFDTLIPFVVKHNALIIQGLVALILLLVALLAVRNFMRGDSVQSVGSGANLDQLEGTLKKLLDRAQNVSAGPISPENERLVTEIEVLRASLTEKQDLIEQMKMAPKPEGGASAVGMSGEDKSVLESQVRDLQAKLAEYEIISEDIADLSFYKEENAKLQKQLESVKGGVAAPAVPPTPEKTIEVPKEPEPVAAPVEDAAMASAAVDLPPSLDEEPGTPIRADRPIEPEIDSAQAMADELMNMPVGELAAATAAEAEAVAAAAQKTADVTAIADEDLLKEFADAVSAQGGKPAAPAATPAAEEPAAGGLFDVERMTQEATQLQKVAKEVKDGPTELSMDASMDADRLALEAASMEAIKPEDAKLMGDFEDFMKKGGGT